MAGAAKHTLSGLVVREAMRRQVIRLDGETPIDNSINLLIKYKVNALLVTGPEGAAVGVVSKSDIMTAYYAGLPIDTPLSHIMVGPPLFCHPETALEDALDSMRDHGVYRLYVVDGEADRVVGALAYPDIVGLLYKYCHGCEYSHSHRRRKSAAAAGAVKRYHVGDAMTSGVQAVVLEDPVTTVMEVLSTYRFGAVLVQDADRKPCGVISKTDLALAYKHGVDHGTPAAEIMSAPVQVCRPDDLLEAAIKIMIYSDVHRLFVQPHAADAVEGVFSLSDAARLRSGSCHACISSRIRVTA